MSLLGTPLIASALARLAQGGPVPRIPAEISFAEVPAQTRMTSAGLLDSLSFVQNKFDHAGLARSIGS